jgi:AAA15 family ATPase/GTPase
MGIIYQVGIKNFECFRDEVRINLRDATFLIGENNSGKSSIFRAISLFFEELRFEERCLNKTLYKGKRVGYNISEITLVFDLNSIKTTALKDRLLRFNNKNDRLEIKKRFTHRDSGDIIEFIINGLSYNLDLLPLDFKQLISSIKLNYIHPQEGGELLKRAQIKLRNRLLDNWGRSTVMSREMKSLEEGWEEYRKQASEYLSGLLTENVKNFWGKGEVKINLPKSVKEIIDIGDITFQMDESFPEISLTSQGTGVQQSLLYYASYVLDSDKTMSRNKEYHPVWLLEEPESFLHADMIIKLSKDLTSSSWLENLQLLVTTHSGLLLSNSLKNKEKIVWNLLEEFKIKDSFNPEDIDYKIVNKIGYLMGDSNFDIYFYSSLSKVFVEDSSNVFVNKLIDVGINAKGIGGISELNRHLKAMDAVNAISVGKTLKTKFILDGDDGKKEIKSYLTQENLLDKKGGFRRYRISNGSTLIILPEGECAEDLFLEFEDYINEQMHNLCGEDLLLKSSCEGHLSSVYSNLKHKYASNPIESWEILENKLRKDDLVKNNFWNIVSLNNYSPNPDKIGILKELLQD